MGQVYRNDAIVQQRNNNRVEELKADMDMVVTFENRDWDCIDIRDYITETLIWHREPGGEWTRTK